MFASEFTCGCIIHPLAGKLRQCGAFGAKSLTGRFIKLEADIHKHNKGELRHRYPVASGVVR